MIIIIVINIMITGHGDKPRFLRWSWWNCGDVQSPGFRHSYYSIKSYDDANNNNDDDDDDDDEERIKIYLSSEESLHSRSHFGSCPDYQVIPCSPISW